MTFCVHTLFLHLQKSIEKEEEESLHLTFFTWLENLHAPLGCPLLVTSYHRIMGTDFRVQSNVICSLQYVSVLDSSRRSPLNQTRAYLVGQKVGASCALWLSAHRLQGIALIGS